MNKEEIKEKFNNFIDENYSHSCNLQIVKDYEDTKNDNDFITNTKIISETMSITFNK